MRKYCRHCKRKTFHISEKCPACGKEILICIYHPYKYFAVWQGKFEFLCPQCGRKNRKGVKQAKETLEKLKQLAIWASKIAIGRNFHQ